MTGEDCITCKHVDECAKVDYCIMDHITQEELREEQRTDTGGDVYVKNIYC